MKCLLLVDIQNDFMPGGALAVNEADQILPLVKQLVHLPFDFIVATKDWHPFDHGSFAENYHKHPGEYVKLAGLNQVLWPRHCVQGTRGSDFAPGWDTTQVDKIVYKGVDKDVDSYSTFFDNGYLRSTSLEEYLKEKGVTEIYMAGLATDYCVKHSALDALNLGFKVYVIKEACRGVNLNPQDSQEAFEKMNKAGAQLVSIVDVVNEEKQSL